MEAFETVFALPFVQTLVEHNGDVYIVGGSVRDHYLGKDAKDVDMIVTGIPFDELIVLLRRTGHADLVGESFGVIKYTQDDITYDIALPRTDRKIEGAKGHKSIETQSDHTLSIEADLYRRDFTINAMAIGRDLQLIDPYGGMEDLADKLISCVAPEAFVDDPLRMKRAVQFAARFNFDIDATTLKLIEDNKHLIKEITAERIFDELAKPFEKNGHIQYFAHLLKSTGLFFEIFGVELKVERLDCTTRLSELLHFGIADDTIKTAAFYKKYHPNINKSLLSELQAFDIVYGPMKQNMFRTMFEAMKKSEVILMSEHIHESFRTPFLLEELPRFRNDVALTGDDLILMGLKEGKETGEAIELMISSIFDRSVENERHALAELVASKFGNIVLTS